MSADASPPAEPFPGRLRAHLAAEIDALDGRVRSALQSDVALIPVVADHLIGAGGKRLRPLLLLLVARALRAPAAAAVELAVVVEFIHTATLLHDDVVDDSSLRRGRRTANAVHGNPAAVLVGDFLYSRAFQLMVGVGRPEVMAILADTTNLIAEGEVMQLAALQGAELSEAAYHQVIRRKTAVLFAAAAELGGVLGSLAAQRKALWQAGLDLGMAFQIADDVLDYEGDVAAIGKQLGDDLAQGKWTLPLILAEQRAADAEAAELRALVAGRDRKGIDRVRALLRQTDALQAAMAIAEGHATAAAGAFRAGLPDVPERGLLEELCAFAVLRRA